MKKFETVYLHVGLEKTGTTSIQESLDQNRDVLEALGYYYPKLFSVGLNTRLAAMFLTDAMTRTNMKLVIDKNGGTQAKHVKKMTQDLAKEVASTDAKTLILSSEFLAAGTDLERLKAWCDDLAQKTQIMVYIREQCSLFVSHQSTHLKGAGQPTDLKKVKKRQDLSVSYNVHGLLSRLERAFPGQVLVRIFDRNKLIGGDAVSDFYQAIQVKTDTLKPETRQSNQSLSLVGSAFLKKMNDIIPLAKDGDLNPARAQIIEDIGIQDSEADFGKRRLSQDEADILNELFAEGNEAIRKKYFPDQDLLFPEYKTGSSRDVSTEEILAYSIGLLEKASAGKLELIQKIKKAQNQKKFLKQDLNEKISSARSERDTALKQAKSAKKKHDKQFKGLSAQILALTTSRDEARGAAMHKEKTIKTLTKARDDARKAFETKAKQSKIQSGQVYYFRAELLRLKDNLTDARKMYQQAIDHDPDNETFFFGI